MFLLDLGEEFDVTKRAFNPQKHLEQDEMPTEVVGLKSEPERQCEPSNEIPRASLKVVLRVAKIQEQQSGIEEARRSEYEEYLKCIQLR